jgi:threonine/homoserine efflux transporter RhtA
MTFHSLLVQPIIALVAGILILVQPSLLSYIVAIYLIIVGVIGLIPQFS